VDVSDLFSR
jgi:hypothetical protein